MRAHIYIRDNGKTPADFSVVMKKHKKGEDKPTFRARVAGGQLNRASVHRLREASARSLYISKKHDYSGYIDRLLRLGYKHYGVIQGFLDEIPKEAAEALEDLLGKYPQPQTAKPARWFNNRKS